MCKRFISKEISFADAINDHELTQNGFGIDMIDEKGKSHITQIVPDSDGHFWYGGKYY